ncbi:amino acid permease [Paralimibaculum aggregatum]|uniref:Amino acid permease n=1 Tax=Paralimibaculum aggregatum TaxID=3036245 RepID=A0ABQ6LR59_9RHOB|nr:amino acid permease [Limibaculum sp. NKW23]GMG83511.1 amino acid permease [Limibaculum sp. NKW23]
MPTLSRRLGVTLLTLYGVGVMVGAGIYVLIGQIAGLAGPLTPLAFVVAGLVAGLSAWSFAELSARVPESAGEAAYAEEAFGQPWLSMLVGFGVIAVGLISAAAILKGGAGYVLGLVELPRRPLELGILAVLGLIAGAGVIASVSVAAALTVIEIVGLLVVAAAGLAAPAALSLGEIGGAALAPGPGLAVILPAALLAFFAFVGFEDMVNMAEETVEPARTMPRAIFLAVAITTLLYGLIAAAALHAVAIPELAASERPLALVFAAGTGFSDRPIIAVAILATLNGVLVQIVMAARVLYGLGRRRRRLAWFSALNPRLRTPLRATAVAVAVVALLTLAAPIETLAATTSSMLLCIFSVVNAALLVLKRRGPPPPGAPNAPVAVPVLGILSSLALLLL